MPERVETEVINDPEILERLRKLTSSPGTQNQLASLLDNPQQIQRFLELNPEQARNIRGILSSMSTYGAHRFLGPYIGEVVAAGLGAAIGAWLSKQVLKGG